MVPRSTHSLTGFVLLLALCACAMPVPSFEESRAVDHNRLGGDALRRGDAQAAVRHFERALEYARGLSDRRQQVDALSNLGVASEHLGRPAQALANYEAALALADSSASQASPAPQPYLAGVYSASLNRSRLLLQRGDVVEARRALDLATAAAAEIGSRVTRASCQKQRALLEQEVGNTERALVLAWEASRLFEISPITPANLAGQADCMLVLGRLLEARESHIDAIAQYRAAAQLGREISDRILTANALESIARVLERLGHLEDARLRLEMALDINIDIADLPRARNNATALLRLAGELGRRDLVVEYQGRLAEIETAAAGTEPEAKSPALP